jgi:hypothetical protein
MNDREAPGEIPGSFLRKYRDARFPGKLRDEPFSVDGERKEAMRMEADQVIAALRRTVCPEP